MTGGAQGLGEGIVPAPGGCRRARCRCRLEWRQSGRAGGPNSAARVEKAIASKVDVAERAQVKAMIGQTVAAFGGIDVLLNNAQIDKEPVPFFDVDEANFNSIIRVNTLGVLLGMQEAGKQMMEQGRGGRVRRHCVGRRPARLCGVRPILRKQGGGDLAHASCRAGDGEAQDYRQRYRARRGADAALGRLGRDVVR